MKISKWIDRHAGYILIIPAVVFIVLFSIAPIVGSLRYAFFDMQLNDQTKNDMYLKGKVNLALNQETIDYLHYYLDTDLDLIEKEETVAKVKEIQTSLDEFENYVATEIASKDLKAMVDIDKGKQETFTAMQAGIVNELEQLYAMDDEFYSPEDAMELATEFESTIIKPNFVGTKNFASVLKDKRVHSTLRFTLIFTAISVYLELILGLLL